jgi:dienelactone hydrolase
MYRRSWARAREWGTALGMMLAMAGASHAAATNDPDEVRSIEGQDVAVWSPAAGSAPYPLVLFSHGVRGCNIQSKYLMRALSQAGFLVVAPNHDDRATFCPDRAPRADDLPRDFLVRAATEGSTFYDERGKNLRDLRAALKVDAELSSQIDFSSVALVGHSLGGYTVLGLAGAWPGRWRMDEIDAVVALAPFVQPFINGGTLGDIEVPVLLQAGTADKWIPPALVGSVYSAIASPACKVVYRGADHFAWTDLDLSARFRGATATTTITFLKDVLGNRSPTAASLASSAADPPECK